MINYQKYMDRCIVEQHVHDKIMNRITADSDNQKPIIFRYASAVELFAYAVIALTVILFMPRWLPPVTNNNSAVISKNQTSAAPTTTPANTVTEPSKLTNTVTSGAATLPGLIFNQAENMASAKRRFMPGYFTEELTREQLSLLFKSALPLVEQYSDMAGIAGFTGEGKLVEISISGESKNGRLSLIMAEKVLYDCVYSYQEEPKTTDIKGVAVTAGYWINKQDNSNSFCFASFKQGKTEYSVRISSSNDKAKQELTELVTGLIEGGAADLSKITYDSIPPWREEDLTLNQAKADPDFGRYVPKSVPSGFALESACRSLDQNRDLLKVLYCKGLDDIHWTISRKTEWHEQCMVDVSKPETYDYSLYPIPRAESVPDELHYQVDNAIFKAEELTLDAVKKREWYLDIKEKHINFGVLCGDIVVEVYVDNVKPETLFAMFQFP